MGLRRATLISLAVHAGLLLLLALGTGLYLADRTAGPGETVSVWIEAPEGSNAGRRRSATPRPATQAKPSGIRDASPDAMRDRPMAEASGSGAGGGSAANSAGATGGLGSGGDELLARIWRRIDSSKYYPGAARRRGISGTPRVTFAISEDGSVAWAKIERSCGNATLDDAALVTVRRAAPLPYYAGPITLAVKDSLGD